MSDIQRRHSNARISKIVTHGGLVYLCGQTAKGSAAEAADIGEQTTEVLSRINQLLAEAGTNATRLLTVTVYLRDMTDFGGMNAVWETWLEGQRAQAPARATVQANLATATLRVEMSVTAAVA
jgi:enamine deaminase RidA (YjgF/YER057c/UK114 family)